ncbi:VanZ family protein [Bacillus haynesii]|uniref:VanZ family protein n=1 Tax=Bacillus haynesii TaxID=1925021 RepID=UPI00228063AB|nr:VanZ family protein [Bacillus haynesii]MCY7912949.1 VanZ family protein [Bacillus haynesii]MCY7927153.1 VanZ family protein [Bacillus haynesii]MCY8044647.1 VanZ family protein [Bacillus haynesii]MCY8078921.1 VanZ family protein [Bacillus haynesii]MCY8383523.1 VanZ family protein [Bacillus haynesii]
MFWSVDFMLLGFLYAIVHFLYDIVKNRKKTSLFRKMVFASFIVYLSVVYHYTIGGINIPPQPAYAQMNIQLIPFYFVAEWVQMYQQSGFDWFFLNSVKLTFFNVLLLIPLGVYLSVLWRKTSLKKAAVFVFLTSFLIESLQLVLSVTGLIMARTFNVDDLILNTAGGVIGFCLTSFMFGAKGSDSRRKGLHF